ncbi:heme exporter protein CcmD [Stenotrophomonas sp. ATCM1_4]|jgi:heme exporter protein D|uniref:Heme exporter protein D n=1 Tax=Stenotrophomonas capsici TaxID=3110230 RepID=A0ABU5V1J3_9GAMM|nr:MULTISPECIES: heme exporter protein CcmD [unclassified Stenotrophomonas]MEA5666668.1 heme exporter protein CcmD [Stenotrophomonas sp. MH1]TDB26937.1 heme exporter protein CcmD [Stenotrophomonas sp. ATCM1_4]
MTYFKYVAMAYAVFFIVLAWDFIVPRLQIRRQLRQARSRVARARQATQVPVDEELSR